MGACVSSSLGGGGGETLKDLTHSASLAVSRANCARVRDAGAGLTGRGLLRRLRAETDRLKRDTVWRAAAIVWFMK